jgi:hypothetical protein
MADIFTPNKNLDSEDKIINNILNPGDIYLNDPYLQRKESQNLFNAQN